MTVTDITTEKRGESTWVGAQVGSSSWSRARTIWFEVPTPSAGSDSLLAADAWLAALLLPAMLLGQDLHIDAPLSSELTTVLPQLQAIYGAWMPSTTPIEVHASGTRGPRAVGDAVGLFFSCGVDSWYSLLK